MDQELIALSEAVEAQVVRDLWANAPTDTKQEIGYRVLTSGDTVVSAAAHETSILVNRTLGLDTGEPADQLDLAETAIALYERLGIQKYFLHINPGAPAALTDLLTDRGLVPGRAWMKFMRDATPVAAPDTGLDIREIGVDHATAFGALVAPCFGMTPAFARILAASAPLPHWHIFMAFEGNTPVGCGSLTVWQGVGLLNMGATHPDHRCKGIQKALMAARINKGADLGLKALFAETGEAVDGEAQHSYNNILKAGFKEWYARQNFMPG